jgi:hypothetical protein
MTKDREPLSVEQACEELRARMLAYRVGADGSLDDGPEVLYHYTSLESACKILETNKLRASRVYLLNDASEVEYGADIVSECLDSVSEIPEAVRMLFRRGLDGAASEFIRKIRTFPFHVFCLSRKLDSLSQWRAYGRSGGGVAIGFKKGHLHKISADGQPNHPFRITYKKEDQLTALLKPLAMVTDIGHRISPASTGQEQFWIQVFAELALFAFKFKNPAFSEEEEWRLLWTNDTPSVQFRLSSDGKILIPYIEAGFSHESVYEIVQGPLGRPEVGESSLREFLDAKNYSHVEVTASEIPLRSL